MLEGRYHYDSSFANKGFLLYSTDDESFKTALLCESARFSAAALETLASISEPLRFPRSIGWALIKLYYAAYFSAHSVMRVFGIALTYLEAAHVNKVSEYAGLTVSPPPKYPVGDYAVEFDAKSLSCQFKAKSNAHKDAWASFNALLRRVSSDVSGVQGLTTSKLAVSGFLDQLVDGLSGDGDVADGSWLSKTRNEINYQQKHGVWFPYAGSNIRFDELSVIIDGWSIDEMRVGNGLIHGTRLRRFCHTCCAIAHLSRLLMHEVAQGHAHSVHQQYGIRYLLQMGVI